ncbi:MAG: cobaltochelatase subunit CobN [Methermicoccaceae archaeon]
MRIAFVIGYNGAVLATIGRAVEDINSEGIELAVWARYLPDVHPEEDVIHHIEEADAVFLHVSPRHKNYELIASALKGMDVPVVSIDADLSNVDEGLVRRAREYYVYGGYENIRSLLLLMACVGGLDMDVPAPREMPWHGIYHRSTGEKGCVGILFYRSAYLNSDTDVYDALIEALEKRGMGVVAVYSDGSIGANMRDASSTLLIERYFADVDVLVSCQSYLLFDTKPSTHFPVLQTIRSYALTEDEWRAGDGIEPMSIVASVALPEVSGAIEPIFIAGVSRSVEPTTGGMYSRHTSVREQVEYLAARCERWIELARKPNSEKKIAIILHNAPCKGAEATVGAAAGLDSLQSVVNILHRMEEAGYCVEGVPESGEALAHMIMEKRALSEFRWTTASQIVAGGGALALLDMKRYVEWFKELPLKTQEKMLDVWGEPAGGEGLSLHDGRIVISGLRFGNVVVCLQPKRGCAGARCDGRVCKILHDPTCPPPHQYIAFYRWLEREFKAHAVIHVGTHGSLEFLPGKGVGLSSECYPQVAIGTLPNLYIYTAINPMEGTIAKRRGYATTIDHLPPILTGSKLYDDYAELEQLLAEHKRASELQEGARLHTLHHQIVELAKRLGLYEGDEGLIEHLHDALTLMEDTQIREGLHVIGETLTRGQIAQMESSMLRNETSVCSIHRCIANGSDVSAVEVRALDAIERVLGGEPPEKIAEDYSSNELREVLELASSLGMRIEQSCEREVSGVLDGLSGRYIEAGVAGSLTRGCFDVLPTGRNLHGADITRVPTRAGWLVGKSLADRLIQCYVEEHGRYPENVGFVLWSTDVYRADGEEVCQILYTMGCKPVWDAGGKVKGIEVIPLEELKRPRVDCTVRISGILRDSCRHIVELLDEAVHRIAVLDEDPEMNYVRKHTLSLVEEGCSMEDASCRIFGTKAGAYGAGVNYAVYSSAWRREEELGEVFIDWSGYSYGKEAQGKPSHQQLASLLRSVDITYLKKESDEFDILDCCCNFSYTGGFSAAAKRVSGRDVVPMFGDTRNPTQPRVRTMRAELERVVRTRLLNPAWIEPMKRHGYRGAQDISKRITHVYGWSATTGIVGKWVYDEIFERFVASEPMRRWFEHTNPFALEEIERRLIEAAERGLWGADKDTLEHLRELYLSMEGIMEERMMGAQGDHQAGSIVVLTKDDVSAWKEKTRDIEATWK